MNHRIAPPLTAVACAALLTACGGGGGSSTNPPPVSGSDAQVCSPNNPYRGDATAATTTGSLTTEKAWAKSYMDAAYLWYDQMPTVNAADPRYSDDTPNGVYPSLYYYFQALKTPATTSTGNRLDRFSFTYPTKDWNNFISGGSTADYGWILSYADALPRNMKVSFVQAGSPAALAGIQRGDAILSVNGSSTESAPSTPAWSAVIAGIYPAAAGQTNTLVVSRAGTTLAPITITSANITPDPVPTVHVDAVGSKRVGYILFNDHMSSSEGKLIDAIRSLQGQAVTDLVIDMRYNGGGYLYVASELAYMVAGSERTDGKIFEKLQYNNKRTADNAQPATPFYNTSCYLSGTNCTRSEPLPTLNLSRVTVLTTDNTCSASEAVINGLRGVNVTVDVVGGTTCGKPYGFTAKDNCGVSYFPIEFKGINNVGFGDYADGFAPTCAAADDLSKPLGSTQEGQYAMALGYITSGTCTPLVGRASPKAANEVPNIGGRIPRGPERENRILVGDRVR